MKTRNRHVAGQVLAVLTIALALVGVLVMLLPLDTAAAPPKDGPSYYYVQYGDTLFSISRRYGITVPALMAANGLTSDYIYAGQRLIIPLGTPQPPPAGFTCQYTVQRRDTVYSIAYRYKVPWYSVMQANYLYTPYIYAGMLLNVPCVTPAPSPFPIYTVQTGDNLFRIAIRYETSIYAIALVNGIFNPNLIFVGQNLVVPYSGTVKYPTNIPPPPTPTFTPTPITTTTVTTTSTPTATPTMTSTASAVVVMTNLTYIPNSLTIYLGTTVLWQNTESATHTVSSGVPGALDYRFRSGPLGYQQTFTYTFATAGTYPYFSELDQGMTGTITVQ